MNSKDTRLGVIALVLVTLIWGLTFPLIKNSTQQFPPFAFVAVRFFIGGIGLWIFRKRFPSLLRVQESKGRSEWLAGALLGGVLFFGNGLQTLGMRYTSASNAAFITGLTVVIVPLILVFQGSKIIPQTWGAVIGSIIGIALLSLNEHFQFNFGDLLVLACATAFALHIVLIPKFSHRFDAVRLTEAQLLTVSLVSFLASVVFERESWGSLHITSELMGSLFYCGILATAVAFLVQTVFQKKVSPVKTALIFSCEPVFGAFFAYWVNSETLTAIQYAGGGLMVLAMVIGEWRSESMAQSP
jgi:drug/metabolite transporter (DMT)-like permease